MFTRNTAKERVVSAIKEGSYAAISAVSAYVLTYTALEALEWVSGKVSAYKAAKVAKAEPNEAKAAPEEAEAPKA